MTTDITELALLFSKAKASVFTLEYISQFEPADIDSDDVDLRFEVDGRDTGTNVSIVDECGQAAKVIGALVEALEKAQHRIAELEGGKVGNALLERENHHVEVVGKLTERIAELESEVEKWKQEAKVWEQVAEKQLATAIKFDYRVVTLKLPSTPEPSAFAPWVAKAFYQFHRDTVKSCFAVFSDACAAAGIKVEAE
ncbi:hypothetical protein [Klebsiella pneumoniae]|uniref:hypothetical protein n=1 Tax=Klebsiella pneumoniae TaxID=573 RepID=UPI0034D16562